MEKIKRLLFVSPSLTYGGAERVVSILTSELANEGYEVSLILYDKMDKEYPVSSDVSVEYLPHRNKNELSILYKYRKLMYLRGLIKRINPDIIIPFLPYPVEHCYYATLGMGIPMVVTVRNNPAVEPSTEKMRKRRNKIARKSAGVFLQNMEQMDYFSNDIKKKCFVIPNPMTKEVLGYECKQKRYITNFICVGSFKEQKNHALLISAFEKAAKIKDDIRLDLVGSGKLESQIARLIRDKGLQDKIHMLGNTSKVTQELVSHDCFVLSSDFEGMPNALMEAMSVGLPCISTKCPTGPNELIGDDERGILVKVGDVDSLSKAMIEVCNNSDTAYRKGALARKYMVEKFSPEQICKQLMSELEGIV